jgi:16S rRNA (cytosine1402-N4)-methyltransferase
MVKECIELLNLRAGKVYVDTTTGGGGHSAAMLSAVAGIQLYCFDQDADAIATASQQLASLENSNSKFEFIKSNFAQMRTELALRKVKGIDGVLFDLGVSSFQLDNAERGFSFDKDAPLDMRMDAGQQYTAFNAVNELDSYELGKIFRDYSEELNARRIAKAIEIAPKPISTTKELARIIESVVGVGSKESLKSKVRIFQALRIHVNNELAYLELAIQDAINMLNPGGRIVVMSYHSLEDRIVKHAFRLASQSCICPPAMIACNCKHKRQLKVLTKSPIVAGDEELKINQRARSAKLRAAEKIDATLPAKVFGNKYANRDKGE